MVFQLHIKAIQWYMYHALTLFAYWQTYFKAFTMILLITSTTSTLFTCNVNLTVSIFLAKTSLLIHYLINNDPCIHSKSHYIPGANWWSLYHCNTVTISSHLIVHEAASRFISSLKLYVSFLQLCFSKGDIITVTQVVEGGWWEGTLDTKTGWFPSNYVKELKPGTKCYATQTRPFLFFFLFLFIPLNITVCS